MSRALVMHPKDNVATVLEDIAPEQNLEIEGNEKTSTIIATEAIPFGHKIALRKIRSNANVLKYGEVIGTATQEIPVGSHVHVHNIKSTRG
ncbi:MAG: UxaA family hydrolase [Nitrospinae bacterium]|nr:UxaA family hydrolase [Nitrospinota bacterium]